MPNAPCLMPHLKKNLRKRGKGGIPRYSYGTVAADIPGD